MGAPSGPRRGPRGARGPAPWTRVAGAAMLLAFAAWATWGALALRRSARATQARAMAEQEMGPHLGAKTGRSVGSQLTRRVPAGVLYSWGLDAGWRLGRIGGDNHAPLPTLPFLRAVSVAASRHTLAAGADGSVWSMGLNNSAGGGGGGSAPIEASGQLGRTRGSQAPGLVEGLEGVSVMQVAAGRFHSVALSRDGRIFTWGLNDWGQLGRPAGQAGAGEAACTSGGTCRSGAPGRVALPKGVKAVGISAGRYSTQAIGSDGALYTWGLDGCATGGDPPPRDAAWSPRKVGGALAGRAVAAISTGYVFWAAATDDGDVFTCGTGDDGYAGTLAAKRAPNAAGELGRKAAGKDALVPGKVAGIQGRVLSVAAGRDHGLAATHKGEVFSWGGGSGGGADWLGRDGPADRAGRVLGPLSHENVMLVAAGEYYSLAATATRVFAWGSNAFNATGASHSARDEAFLDPVPAAGALGAGRLSVYALAAGYQHALALVSGTPTASPPPAGGAVAVVPAGATPAAAGPKSAGRNLSTAPSEGAPGDASLISVGGGGEGSMGGPAGSGGGGGGGRGESAPEHDPASYLAPQAKPPAARAADVWGSWRPGPGFEAVRAVAPDVFSGLPARFNPDYRNPCWGSGPDLTCIPYFHIIGVSKCGTTDLYHRLTMHPAILPARNKGPHFWDECPYPPNGPCGVGGTGDWAAYVKLFLMASDVIRSRPGAVTGEASSNTFTSARGVYARGPAAPRPGGPGPSMPRLLREAAPYLRLILLLRDPGERLYSAYHYYRWWQKDLAPPSPEAFHNASLADIASWRACEAAKGRAACVRGYEPQQLVKGMYAEFLQDWLEHWPRDQLLVMRYEDYVSAPEPHLRAALTFLGASADDEDGRAALARMLAAPAKNRSGNKRAPMLPATRRLLDEFYAPFNAALARALGGDGRWLWAAGERAARGRSAGGGGGGPEE